MLGFKHYLERSEDQVDVQSTLAKLPAHHRKFLQGFAISFQAGNTLDGDDQHVGLITTHPRKQIIIAAPWFYSREFTLLHEVAHLVWEYLTDQTIRNAWEEIVHHTKHKQNQNAEELFCMAYANTYAKHKVRIHDHPEWNEFILSLSQRQSHV
jgi:hypothetical protein